MQVCLRCDDSLWSWHALGFTVVSAYNFFRAIKAGWMLKAQPGPMPLCIQSCFGTKWQVIITLNGTEVKWTGQHFGWHVDVWRFWHSLLMSWPWAGTCTKILRGMLKEFTVWNGFCDHSNQYYLGTRMPRGRKRKAWQPCAVVGLSDNGLRKDAADWLNRREICHSPLTMSSTRGSPVLLCKCIECDGCSKDLFFASKACECSFCSRPGSCTVPAGVVCWVKFLFHILGCMYFKVYIV